MTGSGRRAQPFWPTLARAQRVIKNVPAYHGFHPVEVSWETFRDEWLRQLEADGFLVGVNWSGDHATGYDLEPTWVRRCVEIELDNIATTRAVSPSRAASKPDAVGPEWFRRIFRRP